MNYCGLCGRFMVRGLFISTLISLTGFLAVDAAGMDEAALRADTQKTSRKRSGLSSKNTARAATAAGQRWVRRDEAALPQRLLRLRLCDQSGRLGKRRLDRGNQLDPDGRDPDRRQPPGGCGMEHQAVGRRQSSPAKSHRPSPKNPRPIFSLCEPSLPNLRLRLKSDATLK